LHNAAAFIKRSPPKTASLQKTQAKIELALNFWFSIGARASSMKTFLLYLVTAIAEIVGCYLPYKWLREDGSAWLLLPAGLSLAVFAWLLTLHPAAAGRTYAAYGGAYISVALLWLWAVEGIRPSPWDWAGVACALLGMALIAFQPDSA
jgi:small multidrug resistance family-3 protein